MTLVPVFWAIVLAIIPLLALWAQSLFNFWGSWALSNPVSVPYWSALLLVIALGWLTKRAVAILIILELLRIILF